ncbi:hypothetical protein KIPB_008252, partial [Kipferlia bialata]
VAIPLELDTDGIWCALPAGFPESYTLKVGTRAEDGTETVTKKIHIEYPEIMLNADTNRKFTNHQYMNLHEDENGVRSYTVSEECGIYFEVDGPYRCMVLSASSEEGKRIKKRYAVFNMNGSLAELKGFEIKRRGELQLIKQFQSRVFDALLVGNSLAEAYGSAASVADVYLDIIDTRGAHLDDETALFMIAESTNMRKTVAESAGNRSAAVTTATRLAAFLGETYLHTPSLKCEYIIASQPVGASVTDRAIPVLIFQADREVRNAMLRDWLQDDSIGQGSQAKKNSAAGQGFTIKSCIQDGDKEGKDGTEDDGPTPFDFRDIVDWQYYRERLSAAVVKIVSVPAGLQGMTSSPCPRVPFPDWLQRQVAQDNTTSKQTHITDFFKARVVGEDDTNPCGMDETEIIPHKPVKRPPQVPLTLANYVSRMKGVPDRSKDYGKWLSYMKGLWALQIEQRAKDIKRGLLHPEREAKRRLVV